MSKRINPNESEGLDGDLYEQLKADARGHVRKYGDWKKLAEASGVTKQTISNFAYGLSQPHFRTIVLLMEASGIGDKLRTAFSSETPMFTDQAQKSAPATVKKQIEKRQNAAIAKKENNR